MFRARRSVLYMPGANERALEKAKSLEADSLILDLEDSVAPDAKAEARTKVAAAVKAGGFGRRELVIRINGLDTPWGVDDLKMAAAVNPHAVLVPKVAGATLMTLLTLLYVATITHRLRLVRRSLRADPAVHVSDEDARAVPDHLLPVYTVLVPAYGEPEVLDFFVAVPGLDGEGAQPRVSTVVVDFARTFITALRR